MLDEQTLSINFGQGIDTKTDPKLVVSSKLTALQNAIFTSAKRVSKRNGYDAMTLNVLGGGTIASPTMCKSYRNELLCSGTWSGGSSSGNRLFSYSSGFGKWVDRGKYVSVGVSKQTISAPEIGSGSTLGAYNSSAATAGGISLYTYDSQSSGTPVSSYGVAIDSSTGTVLMSDTGIFGSKGYSKAAQLGSSTLASIYLAAGGMLKIQTLSTAGPVQFNAAKTISTTLSPTAFDVVTTSTGAIVGYASGGNSVVLAEIDTTGTVGVTATIATAGQPGIVSLTQDSGGNIWVFWIDNTTPSSETMYYAIFSSTLSVVLAKTTVASALNNVIQIASIGTTTSQTILYSTVVGGATYVIPGTNTITVQSTGVVGSPTNVLYNYALYSKPFTVSGSNYVAVMFYSPEQSTGFIVDMADYLPVSKFLPLKAEGVNSGGIVLAVRYSGFLGTPQLVTSTQALIPAGYQVQLNTAANISAGLATTVASVQMGLGAMTFDFNHIDAYQALLYSDSVVLNGGFLWMYDGSTMAELGFHFAPDGVSASASTTGGSIPTGNYTYFVTYEWVDANGNLHQSAPSNPYKVTIPSGATNSVAVTTQVPITQKSGVLAVLWRTQNNGSLAYRISATSTTAVAGSLTFTADGATDSTISAQPTLYTQGSAILENLAAPAALVMWLNNNRIWCVDSESPETTIEYSKTASPGSGIAFSAGQLELVVDSRLGSIRAGCAMDEKTVLLKDGGFSIFLGDGANDSGSGSTITNTQSIPSEVGCTNSKSVALISSGIVFRSLSGIYLLSRGTSVQYLGAEVEAYNSQDIRAVTLVPGKSQLRILTSSGSSLVYDYVFNQWSTFTNHSGVSSDVWNGVYIYVRSDGNIYKENSSTFLDGTTAYQLSATTAWIKASQIQGFERVRRIAMLGDFQGVSGHGVQVSAAYDWSTSFSAAIAYSFTGSNAAFQYRERLPQQKCNSLQLQIQEVTTGASGEFVDFSDLGLEIGAKRGLNKLPAAASVG